MPFDTLDWLDSGWVGGGWREEGKGVTLTFFLSWKKGTFFVRGKV